MPLQIVRNDITKVRADAIVNSANPHPVIGGGADSAIYEAAGKEALLKARERIGEIPRGQAAVTAAYNLPAQYIIHTVGPKYIDGNHGEEELLRSCYRESLKLISALKCRTAAFPLISSGSYHFPKDLALQVALDELGAFLMKEDMTIYLVVFDRESFALSSKLFNDVSQYISDHEVRKKEEEEYFWHYYKAANAPVSGVRPPREEKRRRPRAEAAVQMPAAEEKIEFIPEKTFQVRLLELIDKSGMNDPEVYKRAGLDRKLFSKIRSNEDYQPSKRTVIALGLALHLCLDDMTDLLSRAGFALSNSSKADLIIRYCIERKIFDIIHVDAILFEFDQPTLTKAG